MLVFGFIFYILFKGTPQSGCFFIFSFYWLYRRYMYSIIKLYVELIISLLIKPHFVYKLHAKLSSGMFLYAICMRLIISLTGACDLHTIKLEN